MKAGIVSTASALMLSAVLCTIANAFIYWSWRSPELIAAIAASGGLQEAFTLPITLIVPGTLVGAVGATISPRRLLGV